MSGLFIDEAHQAFFDKNGWLKVRMLEADEAAHLLQFYKSLPQETLPEYGFHVSMDKASLDTKTKVINELKAVIAPKAAQVFKDFQIFTGSFVVKEKNPIGVVPPHQDWTFVDESKFQSLTVWTALVPTDMENGCMGVINGSHKFFDYVRASPSPQCKTPISNHMFTLFPYMQLVPMQPGEALIFDNRTIHASPPNTTDQPRIAAGIGITQADAKLLHHYLIPGRTPETLARYHVSPDFFVTYNNGMLSKMHDRGEMPPLKVDAEVRRELPEFSAEEILAMVKSHPDNGMNVALVERLAMLFNYNVDGSKKAEPAAVGTPATAQPSGVKGFFKRIFG